DLKAHRTLVSAASLSVRLLRTCEIRHGTSNVREPSMTVKTGRSAQVSGRLVALQRQLAAGATRVASATEPDRHRHPFLMKRGLERLRAGARRLAEARTVPWVERDQVDVGVEAAQQLRQLARLGVRDVDALQRRALDPHSAN